MSKLYNTLEKIRTGEPGGFSAKKAAPAAGIEPTTDKNRRQRIAFFGVSALLAFALVLFVTVTKHSETKPPTTPDTYTNPSVPAATPQSEHPPMLPPAQPVSPAPSLSGADSDLYRQLNDRGIALIQENQHWRGIYALEQARTLQPTRPEALINMAVALAELGLRAPAKRLFSEAHALAPTNPMLRKNLDLLGQADFFDDQWVASIFAGPVGLEKTREPK